MSRTSYHKSLSLLNPHVAGIDIGASSHWVAVPQDSDPQPVRCFSSFTQSLYQISSWLQQCHITSVVLESTGVYWIPLFELLESQGFTVLLVDPRQLARCSGRPKTDVKDCQWLQRLHSYGLLAGAFRPQDSIVVLRSYLRQRANLISANSENIQHIQKALELMNIKLTEVLSDITGVTGKLIIKSILDGERDPFKLAALRDYRCQESKETIALALQGNWREEHLFLLRQSFQLYEFYLQQIVACDHQIEHYLKTLPDLSGGVIPEGFSVRKNRKEDNRFSFNAQLGGFRLCGLDLTQIEGIKEQTALILLSEIGTDVSSFPTSKHFCSWLGLSPQHKISGGRILQRRFRRKPNRAAQALRLAARSLHRSKSAIGGYFRRMKIRLGTPKAIVATAHKLARLVYALLKHGVDYVKKSLEAEEKNYQERTFKSLEKKATELGFKLSPSTFS